MIYKSLVLYKSEVVTGKIAEVEAQAKAEGNPDEYITISLYTFNI